MTVTPGSPTVAAPPAQLDWDERGDPLESRDAAGTATPMKTTIRWDEAALSEVTTNPSGEAATIVSNAHGELTRLADPLGAMAEYFPAAGKAHRSVIRGPSSALAFSEEKVDEWGRVKRVHAARFLPSGGTGTATPYKPVAEHMPQSGPWPPVAATTLADGLWSKNDGRTTSDVQFNAGDDALRLVDDEGNLTIIRRDAHGRPYQWSETTDQVPPYQNLSGAEYKLRELAAEFTFKEHSTDTSTPFSATYNRREEYDADGHLVHAIDGEGHGRQYEYDEMGHLMRVYDARGETDPAKTFNGHYVNRKGNVTTMHRDGLGRLRHIVTALTADGMGGHAPAPPTSYNSSSEVSRGFVYDEAGNLRAYIDHADNMTQYVYDHALRLEKILYAPSSLVPSGPSERSRTYDTKHRVETSTDARGVTLKYAYD
jgi:YD repeat-containing protein